MAHQPVVYTPADASIGSRRSEDRRTRHGRAMVYSLFMNRRKGARRDEDRIRGHYVDFHEPWLLGLVFLTVVFCVADAYFTLLLLSHGGEELNPFMKVLIEHDVQLFFVIKFIATSLGLLFTIVHKHFRVFRLVSGYHILYTIFFLYLVLVKYEIGLLVANDLIL